MKKIGFLIIAALLVLGLVLPGLSCAPAEEEEEEEEELVLRVAELQPLSGFGAAYGNYAKVAYDLAVEDINDGGGITVDGESYMVEIVERDTVCDPTIAVTLAQEVITAGVDYIVLHGCGTEGQAVLSVIEPANEQVLFALTDDASYISTEHPNAFYIFMHPFASATIQYEYLSDAYPELTRIVGTFPDTAAGQALEASWTEVVTGLGFDIVATIFFPSDEENFLPGFAAVDLAEVDIIEQAGFPGETSGLMVKQLRDDLSYEGMFAEFTGGEFETRVPICGWPALEGMIATGYPAVPVTTFGEDFADRCPPDTPVWVGYFYDQMFLLKNAIEAAGSIDPADVMPKLEEVTFSGVLGEDLHFGGEEAVGLNRLLMHVYVVTQIIDGEPVTVFP